MAIKLNQFHTTPGPGLAERPRGKEIPQRCKARTKAAREEVKLKKKERVPLDFGVFALLPENLVEALEHAIAY